MTANFSCFVVMPFADSFAQVYKKGIEKACHDLNVKCERVDEQIYQGRILDHVYQQIIAADLIIADMTGNNPNVSHEVGCADVLGKDMILITQSTEDIPFDVATFHHVRYEPDLPGLAKLKKELARRIAFYKDPQNSSGLTGRWILAIFNPSATTSKRPYKIDGYMISQRGNSLVGRIERIVGEGASCREYTFSGYTDGQAIVYSFWSKRVDVNSWGCCSLDRAADGRYKGYYFPPQGKAVPGIAQCSEQITLLRAASALKALGSNICTNVRSAIKAWI